MMQNVLSGKRGRFESVDKNLLRVDNTYQRDRTMTKELKYIIENFDITKFGILIVADYGNHLPEESRFYVIDGGGRLIASKQRPEIELVPCAIYNLTPKEAAEVYYDINTRRKQLSSSDKFKAALIFEDNTACGVERVLKSNSIRIAKGESSRSIDSLSTCIRYYNTSPTDFEFTIKLLSDLCIDTSISQYLLKGTFYLVRNIIGVKDKYGKINVNAYNKLKDRMCHIGSTELHTQASLVAIVRNAKGDRALAEGMLDRINRNLKSENMFELKSGK